MAGTNSNFNSTKFRDAITFAMNMGLPPRTADRATFHWKPAPTFAKADPRGIPYNFTQPALTTGVKEDIQIPVAVQFTSRLIRKTVMPAGEINDNEHLIVVVLDTYFDQVADADQIILGGNLYNIDFIAPPEGLFDVEVYQFFCTSVDEA